MEGSFQALIKKITKLEKTHLSSPPRPPPFWYCKYLLFYGAKVFYQLAINTFQQVNPIFVHPPTIKNLALCFPGGVTLNSTEKII